MRKSRLGVKDIAGMAMMLTFLAFALLPILWALILSFRPSNRLFEPTWESPTALSLENFHTLAGSEFPRV